MVGAEAEPAKDDGHIDAVKRQKRDFWLVPGSCPALRAEISTPEVHKSHITLGVRDTQGLRT